MQKNSFAFIMLTQHTVKSKKYNETRKVSAAVFLAMRLLKQIGESILSQHHSVRTEQPTVLGVFLN
jgi:hypothetical protein